MYYRRRVILLLLGLAGSVLCAWTMVQQNVQIPQNMIGFPHAVDSALILEGIVGYEGAFVEAGDEEVVDVAALIVSNPTDQMIQHAKINIQYEGGTYEFVLSFLPPGKSAMVLEQNAQLWLSQPVFSCEAEYSLGGGLPEDLLVQQMADGVVALTNTSDKSLKNIKLYHKNWSKEAEMYLGGIAYETYVGDLEPGQFSFLKPKYYIFGVSHIVDVYTD